MASVISPIDPPRSIDPSSSLDKLSVPVIQIPEVMGGLFTRGRYKVYYGGRGGVKSWSFARALLLRAAQEPIRVLCAREFQSSIKESVHQLLCDQIKLMGLSGYYPDPKENRIEGLIGSEFIFAGLKKEIGKVKSMEGIDVCWVEEAEKVSENSWSVLLPTIRKPGSEIWISFNPHQETDPTYRRFIINREAILMEFPGSIIQETSWRDNPWLPAELQKEKDYLARVDKDAYDHVWGGQVQKKSAAQVMHGKCIVDEFIPGDDWNGPYYGADWGFASDPATLIKMWIHERRLYVEYEFWGIGVELNDLPDRFLTIPGSRDHVIRADSARPETISYLRNFVYRDEKGIEHADKSFPRIVGVEKWPGSVEDGISFLRSFEKIVIHPRCSHTDEESRTYKHKIDPLTGDVLPEIVDKNNHCWDPIRYALQPLIRSRALPGLFVVGKTQVAQPKKEIPPEVLAKRTDYRLQRWLRGD